MTLKLINEIKLKKRVTTRKVSVCTAWSNSGGRKCPIYNLCDGSADITVDLKSEIYIGDACFAIFLEFITNTWKCAKNFLAFLLVEFPNACFFGSITLHGILLEL